MAPQSTLLIRTANGPEFHYLLIGFRSRPTQVISIMPAQRCWGAQNAWTLHTLHTGLSIGPHVWHRCLAYRTVEVVIGYISCMQWRPTD